MSSSKSQKVSQRLITRPHRPAAAGGYRSWSTSSLGEVGRSSDQVGASIIGPLVVLVPLDFNRASGAIHGESHPRWMAIGSRYYETFASGGAEGATTGCRTPSPRASHSKNGFHYAVYPTRTSRRPPGVIRRVHGRFASSTSRPVRLRGGLRAGLSDVWTPVELRQQLPSSVRAHSFVIRRWSSGWSVAVECAATLERHYV